MKRHRLYFDIWQSKTTLRMKRHRLYFDIGQRERHFERNGIVYILISDRERLHFEWNDIAYILITDRERLLHFEWNDIVYILISDRERHFEWNDIVYNKMYDRERTQSMYTDHRWIIEGWCSVECEQVQATKSQLHQYVAAAAPRTSGGYQLWQLTFNGNDYEKIRIILFMTISNNNWEALLRQLLLWNFFSFKKINKGMR